MAIIPSGTQSLCGNEAKYCAETLHYLSLRSARNILYGVMDIDFHKTVELTFNWSDVF